ncbi:urea ABC transporter permease subunit UrtB [Alphaproteobacteria bacterium]|nr:urea ABC transporter permease subunit UrtB [Alphaproteobacteria bacterium]
MYLFKFIFIITLFFGAINNGYASQTDPIDNILINDFKLISKSSSKTIIPVINKILSTKSPKTELFLNLWKDKDLYFLKKNNVIVTINQKTSKGYELIKFTNNKKLGFFSKTEIKNIKPNSGVRAKISNALIGYEILNSNKSIRKRSLESLSRNFQPKYLTILETALVKEKDPALKKRMKELMILGTIKFSNNKQKKILAISSLKDNMSVESRGILSNLLESKIYVSTKKPKMLNLARIIIPGVTVKNIDGSSDTPLIYFGEKPELSKDEALKLLIKSNLIKNYVSLKKRDDLLKQNIKNGAIENIMVASLNTNEAREKAYKILANLGKVPAIIDEKEINKLLKNSYFYATYNETDFDIITVSKTILNNIIHKVKFYKYLDLFLDGLSLSSIYFLAAIGLAITFGVMRVINMAHGEFIMIGAYTGYVVQLIIPNHTLSLLIAFPLAFIVTFLSGVIMERLVIRHLYKNPLDTLLATFGISIALQQIAKNIFGTQAMPLTSPDWLDGAFIFNDVLSISLIRVAIFALGIIFLILILLIMNKTRLGLETKAVTQNPMMASSMGINPDKINMLTFGFGSGIAGVAGVAIGLFSKVTSEIGSDYIVQSFMTVVVGGVGSIWGTLAGSTLIGMLQKFIEWFNPSNTLAAQTYMIIFIIIFIQFRPKGIISLKGRASED